MVRKLDGLQLDRPNEEIPMILHVHDEGSNDILFCFDSPLLPLESHLIVRDGITYKVEQVKFHCVDKIDNYVRQSWEAEVFNAHVDIIVSVIP